MPIVIEYALCLVETGVIFLFFSRIMETRFKNGAWVILFILAHTTIALFCTAFTASVRAAILLAVTVTGCCAVYKGKFHMKYALSVTVLFLISIIDIVFGLLASLVLDLHITDVFFESTIRRAMLGLGIKTVDVLVILAICKMFSQNHLEAGRKMWNLFSVIITTFLSFTIIFNELYRNIPEDDSVSRLYFTASIAFFITGIITIYFFTYVCNSFHNEKRLYVLQNSYDGIKQQLSVQAEHSKAISKIRHDTKNHLHNAKALISQGRYKAAESLVDEMIGQADNIRLSINALTGNDIIDAAIAVKSALCKSQGIEFKLSCESLPHVNISEIDLSSIISNILDNAVTAAEKTDNPMVELKIFIHGDYLNIMSQNTYSNEIKKTDDGKFATLLTTKHSSEEHGFGTRIIAEIAQKYDGACVYKYDNRLFAMNVMLNYKLFENGIE